MYFQFSLLETKEGKIIGFSVQVLAREEPKAFMKALEEAIKRDGVASAIRIMPWGIKLVAGENNSRTLKMKRKHTDVVAKLIKKRKLVNHPREYGSSRGAELIAHTELRMLSKRENKPYAARICVKFSKKSGVVYS